MSNASRDSQNSKFTKYKLWMNHVATIVFNMWLLHAVSFSIFKSQCEITKVCKCCYTIFVFSCVKMHHRFLLTKKFHFDHRDNLILYDLYDLDHGHRHLLSVMPRFWVAVTLAITWKLQRFEFSIGIFLSAESCNILQFQLWKRNPMQ